MNIWLINHYAVPPQYYPLARQTYFAKHLMEMGHSVTIFAASTVHNSDKNLITDGSAWREETVDGVHYVYIKCLDYAGNGLKRVYNICEFAWKLPGVCKKFPRPDAIVATSMPPTSCAMGVYLGKKWGCRTVAEIADLWPESIVAYGIAGPKNPAVVVLRWLEKWIYKKADVIVFTMEGAYDYIIEQGWEREIPREKVHHINNGVDLELFNYNRDHFQIEDEDLKNPDTTKIIYTGSVRKANDAIPLLPAIAQELKNRARSDVQILVYGSGDVLESMRSKCNEQGLDNIIFKGRVEKKYIPYVLSCADVLILNLQTNSIYRFGTSQNKMFEYLAAGKPILSGQDDKYSIVRNRDCGISKIMNSPEEITDALMELVDGGYEEEHICGVAKEYDFKFLTSRLVDIISGKKMGG